MKNSKPLISVVIPAYNEEKYLPKCLKSLKNQNFKGDYEIIVVDNNSTDNTQKIAKKEGAKVVFEAKKGVCFARQKGTKKARGEIVVSTDADCIFPKNWLLNIYKSFKEDPKVVAVVGPCDYDSKPRWGRWWIRLVFGAVEIFYKLTGKILYASATNFAFKKENWSKIGGYNTNLTQAGDEYYLLKKLKNEGKIVYLKDNKVSTSSRRLKKGLIYNIFVTLILYYFFDYFIATRITGKSIMGSYPSFREEESLNFRARKRLFKIIIASFIIAFFIYYLFFSSTSGVFGKVISKAKVSQKEIALTFDDGPNEPYTSEILNILDKYKIKATFFEVGKNIEKYPNITLRIFQEGHIIGNHSWSHSLKKPITELYFRDEILKTQDIIYKITGKKPKLFRPPWLFRDPFMLKTAKNYNLITITGSFGSDLEVFQPDYKKIARSAIKKARPGTILIFHDGYNTEGGYREETVKAVELVIQELSRKGYKFVTVPELLGVQPYQ